jgi:pimeloyl-ACP methyl ester carboxylesterase/uncharacterized protein YceK
MTLWFHLGSAALKLLRCNQITQTMDYVHISQEAAVSQNFRMISSPYRIAAVLAITALTLSGCASTPAQTESNRQQETFPGVYAQTIDWGVCDDDFGLDESLSTRLEGRGAPVETFRCGMIDAPLDWDTPGGQETITLAAVHIPATGDNPIGTLFGNPGGPGGSGLEYTFGVTVTAGAETITENYDLLGFDPRGIGRSSPIVCDDVSNVMAVQLATCAYDNPLSHSMGTSQVARDMDLLRHLMGEDHLDYLGYSYGTMLGATYSTLFPDRVGRMVLDSANSAEWASLLGNFDQNRAIAEAVVEMVTRCGIEYQVEACPVSDEESLLQTLKNLEDEPLLASDETQIDFQLMSGYLTSALYTGVTGRELALTNIAAALSGDQAAIDTIAEAMSSGGAQVGLAGTIVRCHSFPEDPDIPGLLIHMQEAGLPELMGGPDLDDEIIAQFTDLSCFGLAESGDDITDSFSGSPDSTILVIGITGDHATPFAGAERLVKELGNARLLTLDGQGHAASFSTRSSCADSAVTAFLVEGTLPAEGTVCFDD